MRTALLSTTPAEIERELPILEKAMRGLQKATAAGAEDGEAGAVPDHAGAKREELEALQIEVQQVERLLASGAEFHAGWAKMLAAATGGYAPDGTAVPLSAHSSLSFRG